MLDKFPWLDGSFEFFKSIYVLDTNVLLNLYRVQVQNRDALLVALDKAKPYLWMPSHVAREFLQARSGVITEYKGIHRDINNQLKSAIDEVIDKFKDTPYVQGLASLIDGAVQSVYSSVNLYGDRYECSIENDSVLKRLTAIYNGRIADTPSEEVVIQRVKDARIRVQRGLPPGQKDAERKKKERAQGTDDPIHWPSFMRMCTETC